MKTWLVMLVLTLLAASAQAAGDVAVLDGCLDQAGRAIPLVADPTLTALVATNQAGTQTEIRHNPAVLPHLDPTGRLFFQAHACAQVAAGKAGKEPTTDEARAIDCLALKLLLDAGALPRDRVGALQRQLTFGDEEWADLPGPRRVIDFSGCRLAGNVLRLPLATPPSARQAEWNACERVCGDRLWACQKHCKGAACVETCLEAHHACEAGCGGKPD